MIPMQCIGCGANLEIEVGMGLFACAYCGARQQVSVKGGTVSLKPVTDAIKSVQRGTDRTAAELAMPRLERELAENAAAHKTALAKPVPLGNNWATKYGAWALCVGLALLVIAAATKDGFPAVHALSVAFGILGMVFGGLFIWVGGKFHGPSQRRRLKASRDNINDVFGDKSERIARQIKANRAILDAEHEHSTV